MSVTGQISAPASSIVALVGEAKRPKRETKAPSFSLNHPDPQVPLRSTLSPRFLDQHRYKFAPLVRPSVCVRRKSRKDHAFNQPCSSPDRGRRPFVAGESLHSHGRKHQVHLERRGGHSCCVLAPECIWTDSFSLTHTRWVRKPTDRE